MLWFVMELVVSASHVHFGAYGRLMSFQNLEIPTLEPLGSESWLEVLLVVLGVRDEPIILE